MSADPVELTAPTRIGFMRAAPVAAALSVLMLVLSIGSLAWQGLEFGLDFTEGTLLELEFDQPVAPADVRQWLDRDGYEGAVVQTFGRDTDLLIRVPPQAELEQPEQLADRMEASLRAASPVGLERRRAEFVGPVVGEELREDGGLAMLAALLMVSVYIFFRFTGKFAIAALLALVHDVVITLGVFSALRWTFDLPSLAAVLAIIGYSLNDTIVVADRIRENFRRTRRETPREVLDLSINQTLGRTTLTSGTTLLTMIAVALFGGEMLAGFAWALIVGIVVGTYSSIYIAAALLIALGVRREDLLVPVKENVDPDRP